MTIGKLKKLIAELPPELDKEQLWYIEVMGHDVKLVVLKEQDNGQVSYSITGDTL